MFKYNQFVKDKQSGIVYRTVAPNDDGRGIVVVWADLGCTKVTLFNAEELEATDERPVETVASHLVWDVLPANEDASRLEVRRVIDAVGLQAVIAVYNDLRNYITDISDMDIKTVDSLVTKMEG